MKAECTALYSLSEWRIHYLSEIIRYSFLESSKFNKSKILDEIKNPENQVYKKYNNLVDFHNFKSDIVTDKSPQNFIWIGQRLIEHSIIEMISMNDHRRTSNDRTEMLASLNDHEQLTFPGGPVLLSFAERLGEET